MKKLNSLTLLLLLFSLTSCANYISRVHRELDRDAMKRKGITPPDKFEPFRDPNAFNQDPRNASPRNQVPHSFSQGATSDSMRNVAPAVRRQYMPQQQANKRVTASDLNDNDNRGSLWVNNGEPVSLFTDNRTRGQGDIVLVNVFKQLKNEITAELKRAFPDPPTPKKQDAAADPAAPEVAENREPANDDVVDEEKVYDKISTVIVEEINRDHVLLRGRKNLLFRNRKRLVEIQALVARRDLGSLDAISSDNIVESTITVLR